MKKTLQNLGSTGPQINKKSHIMLKNIVAQTNTVSVYSKEYHSSHHKERLDSFKDYRTANREERLDYHIANRD